MNTLLVREAGLDWAQLARILVLSQYNTRIVVAGVTILGIAAGVIGTFLLLRRRALFGDAISHATLPGIGVAYILMVAILGDGKNLFGLLAGAMVFGLLGMAAILAIRAYTPVKEETAIGVVLSVFFGAGVALMGVIQKMSTGHAAGLESYIYGKTASMIAQDAQIIAGAAAFILVVTVLFMKELNVSTFDPGFAAAEGYPVRRLDALVVGLAVLLTVIGLQAVGLILVIALLIIPAAAARFWTDRVSVMAVLAGAVGAASGYLGAATSAAIPNLPAGAIIVLTAGAFFVMSMVFGAKKGLIVHLIRMRRFARTLAIHRFLVTSFRMSAGPAEGHPAQTIDVRSLREMRAGRRFAFLRTVWLARRRRLIERSGPSSIRLTETGMTAARDAARNHELQHLYLRAFPEHAQGLHQRDEEHIEDFVSADVLAILHAELRTVHPELYQGVPS